MKDSNTRDQELFMRIHWGDEVAFTQIFDQYFNTLYSYALKIVRSEFWAEEVVQTLFLQLWTNRATLIDIDNPVAYMYRMAANRSLDWIRKNEAEVRLQYYLVQQKADHFKHDPEQQFDFRFSDKLLQEAINGLPEQRKLIYQLKDSGASYDAIAMELQLSKHTVRNQLAKALQTIRKYLLENGAISMVILFYFERG